MRLLDVRTFQLRDCGVGQEVPSYAILSHRWYSANEELTYQDFQSPGNAPTKRGYTKLKAACEVAAAKGHDYIWCDTCCINKDSETELGTSLNSMFLWYRDAAECIAYLGDVDDHAGKRLEDSVWFKRGWTLQELIAPRKMAFYGAGWQLLGTKDGLQEELSAITRIPKAVLSHATHFREYSIAARMSWAADRETGLVEDLAYSLMGLFELNIKMVYGEGQQAFIKLQREIIQTSADQSIFTWSLDPLSHPNRYSGLLAPSPRSFTKCSDVVVKAQTREYSLSNIGLSINLPTLPYAMDTYYAFLDCTHRHSPGKVYAILIKRLPTEGQYARVMNDGDASTLMCDSIMLRQAARPLERQIWIRGLPEAPLNRAYGFWLRKLQPPHHEASEIQIFSRGTTLGKDRLMMDPQMAGSAGLVSFKPTGSGSQGWSRIRWIRVGFDDDFNPVLMIANQHSGDRYLTARAVDEVLDSEPGSQATDRLFLDDQWARTELLKSRQVTPLLTNAWRGGHFIMTFDETRGYAQKIDALNLTVSIRLLPDRDPDSTSMQGSPGSTRPREVWTVELITHGADSPEHDRRMQGCSACATTLSGIFCALLGCGCIYEEGINELKEGHFCCYS